MLTSVQAITMAIATGTGCRPGRTSVSTLERPRPTMAREDEAVDRVDPEDDEAGERAERPRDHHIFTPATGQAEDSSA